jgi:hypothetical protein
MEVTKLEQVKPDKAAELYKKEIGRVYRLISEGKTVVKALESIAKASIDETGFPKLAIARSDQKRQSCFMHHDGAAQMSPTRNKRGRDSVFAFPPETFAFRKDRAWRAEAVVPVCPIHLRPKRALENYHTLWEAEWTGQAPYDPILLRRLGRDDVWLVMAAWDLTEVERAVLTGYST